MSNRRDLGRWSIDGKLCLITGATSGHGRALAKLLARRGARLVLLGRNQQRCEETASAIAKETHGDRPRILLCDLARMQDVEQAAKEFSSWGEPLDLLVNNAGMVSLKRQHSADGLELCLAVNYLAHFQFTLSVLDSLQDAGSARIINVGSDGHKVGRLDLDDMEMRRGYSWWRAYGRSKLAILLFTQELARRLAGTGITVNAVDPGPVASNIAGHDQTWFVRILNQGVKRFFPSPERAASMALALACAPELSDVTGAYFRFGRVRAVKQTPDDPALAAKLWRWSAQRCAVDISS